MSVGKLKRYGLPFANVVASGVATANVTPGRTIEQIRLKLGGTTFTKAMITLARVKANGKTIIEATGDQLDKLNTFRGKAANAAYLDIDFSDFSMNNEFDRHVGAFDTSAGIANVTLEITIAGATAPTLVAIVTESASQKTSQGENAPYAGILTKILRYPYNISSGGRLPITVPFGPAIRRDHQASACCARRQHDRRHGEAGRACDSRIHRCGKPVRLAVDDPGACAPNQLLQRGFCR